MDFSEIVIIFNPQSTGASQRLAEACLDDVQKRLPKVPSRLLPTQHAGHAEQLAYEAAMASARPLIISASGDGGYHEVVNGVLRAAHDGATATTGLLPGGNANDHHGRLHDENFLDNIVSGSTRQIDVLLLVSRHDGQEFSRYAHSYIGLGFTPWVGRALNRASLNRWNEMWITLHELLTVRATRLIVAGREEAYRSLVCTNIGRMAKYLNLAHESEVDDGKFEVSMMVQRSRLHMFAAILKASTVGLASSRQVTEFSFVTTRPTLVQLDGEIQRLDAGAQTRIEIVPRTLRCIV